MGQTGAINAKVCATKSRLNLPLRTHPIKPWDPKLMFLLHFVMFGCIYDNFVTALNSAQMGQFGAINAKVRATKSRQIFSQRTHLIHTMGHKTQVLLHFVMFGCIWDHFVTTLNSMQMGQSITINAKVRVKKSRSNLSLRTRLIHTIGP